jgi:hypothetical protein
MLSLIHIGKTGVCVCSIEGWSRRERESAGKAESGVRACVAQRMRARACEPTHGHARAISHPGACLAAW